MTLRNALKLHTGDEVLIKKTHEILRVIEVEIIEKEHTTNTMTCVDLHLSDGQRYGHKKIQ